MSEWEHQQGLSSNQVARPSGPIPGDRPTAGVRKEFRSRKVVAGTSGARLRPSQVVVEASSSSRRCACGKPKLADGECAVCRAQRLARQRRRRPSEIMVRPAGDAFEREAKWFATRVGGRDQVRQRRGSDRGALGESAPPIVERALRSSGQPLDRPTRTLMEARLGVDLGAVRVHTGSEAAESAHAVGAPAYTVGNDVVFAPGRYAPTTIEGRAMLAHELAHVVQQAEPSGGRWLQRFEADEVSKIAPTYQDMLQQVTTLVDAATNPDLGWVDMAFLVEIAGGSSFLRGLGAGVDEKILKKKKGHKSLEPATILSRLHIRYLFTCRCGLIDMRHFFQMFYLADWAQDDSYPGAGNLFATRKGREHELDSESESRFAPEDTPSNALAALAGEELGDGIHTRDRVISAITQMMALCDPVDFGKLSKKSQDAIVKFYGAQMPDPKAPGSKVPSSPNETALPDVLDIPECRSRDRSFPFGLMDTDSDQKTIEDRRFAGGAAGAKSGRQIREFVAGQRPEVIRLLPLAEKIRMLRVLLSDDVSDDDRSTADVIEKNSTQEELSEERDALDRSIKPLPVAVLNVPVPPPNYDPILVPLLKQHFKAQDVVSYGARLAKLKAFFRGMEPQDARRLLERLKARRKGDVLSEAFHDNLSTAARRELLPILDR